VNWQTKYNYRTHNRLLHIYTDEGLYWFRMLGYGLQFKDSNRWDISWPELYALSKSYRIGRWKIEILTNYPHYRWWR